jgi:hypothetical protein
MRKSMNVTTACRTHSCSSLEHDPVSGKTMLKPKVPSSNPAAGRGKMPV